MSGATPETKPPRKARTSAKVKRGGSGNKRDPAALQWMSVADLTPWDKNPRRNDDAVPAVARSIQKFGFLAPVVAWGSQRRIIAGHTRVKAVEYLRSHRWDDEQSAWVKRETSDAWQDSEAPAPYTVPVRLAEFASEEDASAYAMADNRLGELADWSDELADVLKSLEVAEYEIDALGFSDSELSSLLGPSDYDDVEWKTFEGDVGETTGDKGKSVTCPNCDHGFKV